ncbi:cationic peptide response regulator transcription factor CprR [Enterobacter hormaechei]
MHVLLTEDDDLIASGIVAGLNAQGLTVDRVASAADTQALLQVARFDVLVLDLGLPDEDGLRLLQRLRQQGVDLPVLELTARDAVTDRVAGLQAGADDYLLKPFELPELLVRLQALSRRRSGQAQRLQVDDLVMDLDSRQASRGGTPLALSPTAWKILECLMRASPALVTREQLGRSVWGDEPPESNTLNVHMHHLRSTVDKGFATPLIHTLHSVGFQLERK